MCWVCSIDLFHGGYLCMVELFFFICFLGSPLDARMYMGSIKEEEESNGHNMGIISPFFQLESWSNSPVPHASAYTDGGCCYEEMTSIFSIFSPLQHHDRLPCHRMMRILSFSCIACLGEKKTLTESPSSPGLH